MILEKQPAAACALQVNIKSTGHPTLASRLLSTYIRKNPSASSTICEQVHKISKGSGDQNGGTGIATLTVNLGEARVQERKLDAEEDLQEEEDWGGELSSYLPSELEEGRANQGSRRGRWRRRAGQTSKSARSLC